MIHILTDSTVNLPFELVARSRIRVVPIYLHWDAETLREGVGIDTHTLLGRLRGAASLPTITQAPVSDFVDAYRQILAVDAQATILAVMQSGALSGTLASAQVAAGQVADADIRIFDTRSCTAGQALLVREAVLLVEAGRSADDILAALDAMRETLSFYLIVTTLEHLHQSGRLWGLARMRARMGDGVGLVTLNDGAMSPVGIFPDRRAALDAIAERATKLTGRTRVAVQHALCEEDANRLGGALRATLAPDLYLQTEMGPVYSYYGGDGALAGAWCPAPLD